MRVSYVSNKRLVCPRASAYNKFYVGRKAGTFMSGKTENIRNITVVGHASKGKTTLTEAMLYNAKMTDRMGKVADGNTVTDFDGEETKRQFSISTAVAACPSPR